MLQVPAGGRKKKEKNKSFNLGLFGFDEEKAHSATCHELLALVERTEHRHYAGEWQTAAGVLLNCRIT